MIDWWKLRTELISTNMWLQHFDNDDMLHYVKLSVNITVTLTLGKISESHKNDSSKTINVFLYGTNFVVTNWTTE